MAIVAAVGVSASGRVAKGLDTALREELEDWEGDAMRKTT